MSDQPFPSFPQPTAPQPTSSQPSEPVPLTARATTLPDLVGILRSQHAAKVDVVTPAAQLRAERGLLRVADAQHTLSIDGVTRTDAVLAPTEAADAGIARKLDIPGPYLRRLRKHHLGLYDANVNGWLDHQPARRFLVRGLSTGPDRPGILRALLSDAFRILDNLDVLLSALDGIQRAGAQVDIAQADLTDTRMYLKVRSTAIAEAAPALLGDYVSPFTGARGADNPLVFAGFVISNSETGHGSFKITPQITVQICDNGLTLTQHALKEVHLGGRLATGQIRWAADTECAALDLVVKQTRDAVSAFLDRQFLQARVADIQARAGVRIDRPVATLEHVAKTLRFTTQQQETILAHFITGGDRTSGGVLQAVTSAAQTVTDADTAHEMEGVGIRAMELAAAYARSS